MQLRELKKKDATLMMEWMHDKDVIRYMQKDFSSFTISDCLRFIDTSKQDGRNMHLAIVSEQDVYMGTASLKNIDASIGTAEFAITIRKNAMGQGYSKFGMFEILRIAFCELSMRYVYWYVNNDNKRALRFYNKLLFERVDIREYNEIENMHLNEALFLPNISWYVISNIEYRQKIKYYSN